MRLSEEKKEMLCSLIPCISRVLCIGVGLSTPEATAVADSDEFIVYASMREEALPFELLQDGVEPDYDFELVHKSDFRRDIVCGPFVGDGVAEFMVGEKKVKDFLATVDAGLLDGTLYFFPSKDFILEKRLVTLTKESDDTWTIKVKSDQKIMYFQVSPTKPFKHRKDFTLQEFRQLVREFEA